MYLNCILFFTVVIIVVLVVIALRMCRRRVHYDKNVTLTSYVFKEDSSIYPNPAQQDVHDSDTDREVTPTDQDIQDDDNNIDNEFSIQLEY